MGVEQGLKLAAVLFGEAEIGKVLEGASSRADLFVGVHHLARLNARPIETSAKNRYVLRSSLAHSGGEILFRVGELATQQVQLGGIVPQPRVRRVALAMLGEKALQLFVFLLEDELAGQRAQRLGLVDGGSIAFHDLAQVHQVAGNVGGAMAPPELS